MKKIFFCLTVLIACAYACKNKQASIENEEKDLRNRFTGFLKAIGEMNIDSIQAYAYPKLFTILSRDQSRESMERSYAFLKGKAELDSVKIDTIQPVLHIDKGSYSIAICSMIIKMPLDSAEKSTIKHPGDSAPKPPIDRGGTEHVIDARYPAPQGTLMATLMKNAYGIDVTSFEEADGMRTMGVRIATIAVKDEFAKEWGFFTIIPDQELINKLFPRKVLEKLVPHN